MLHSVYAKLKGTPQRALCMSYRLFFLVVVFLDGDLNLDAVLVVGCGAVVFGGVDDGLKVRVLGGSGLGGELVLHCLDLRLL